MYKTIELNHIKFVNLSIEYNFIINKLNLEPNNIYKSFILYNDNINLKNINSTILYEDIERCMYISENTNNYLIREEILLSNSDDKYKYSYIIIQLYNNELIFARNGKINIDDDYNELFILNNMTINNFMNFFDEDIINAIKKINFIW